MKVWACAVVLAAASFLVAAPRMWSRGEPTPQNGAPPAPVATMMHADVDGEMYGPPAPQPLAHRVSVLERFFCADCHGVERGWLMPADHVSMPEAECASCHRPAAEPSPIAVHEGLAHEQSWGDCGLCHVAFADLRPAAPASQSLCIRCHGESVDEVLPPSHAMRSDMPSTCVVCHEQRAVEFPPVPHETENWNECGFCHGPQRLTPLEGAHIGERAEECFTCHDVLDAPDLQDRMHEIASLTQGCASCHAVDRRAPLPPSHDDYTEPFCALCHKPARDDGLQASVD